MFGLVENGVVVQISNYARDGFSEFKDVSCGMLYDGENLRLPEETDDQQVAEIDAKLSAIDVKKVRPMSAILAAIEGDDTSEDLAYLSELETQTVALRAQRAELANDI